MPLTKTQKEEAVLQLHEELEGLRNLVVLEFRGLKVAEADELRRKVRESESTYRVVKNRLALLALQGTEVEPLSEHFDGPTAIAHHPESLVDLAKVIQDFMEDHESLQVKAALLDGKVLGTEELAEIAKLPGLEELRAQVLGVLTAPLTGLLGLLDAVPRELAVVFSEAAKKREEAGETAPAPEAKEAEAAPAEEPPAAEEAPAAEEVEGTPADGGETSQ
jgi:large subunit ribosomal protein L10